MWYLKTYKSILWIPHSLLHHFFLNKAWRVLWGRHDEPEGDSGRLVAHDDVWHAGEDRERDSCVSDVHKSWVMYSLLWVQYGIVPGLHRQTKRVLGTFYCVQKSKHALTRIPDRWARSSWRTPELPGKGTFHWKSNHTRMRSTGHVAFFWKKRFNKVN